MFILPRPTAGKDKAKISQIDIAEEELTDSFKNVLLTIDTVGASQNKCKGPICSATICSVNLDVMADSGSPITILSDVTFDRLWSGKQLQRTDVNPKAFGEFDIAMKGFFTDVLDFKSRCINTKIYVAERGRDILGWQDQAKLCIILRPGHCVPVILGDVPVLSVLEGKLQLDRCSVKSV
ncbi:hypothetical protein NDU88_001064 [Pleurodeles waltl]|uniref:Peptidase A2 domain-containing protein n=1 Tax=Pleurodeles waltl TaxID=8319 RepID=A0AAV7R634_PLEWA|nr:hypothetical protein NDU88_001064 [Pleurodeles waltl]